MPSWKDPICPLLLLGGMYHDAPHLPSLADIRFHVSATMRSARLPTACTSNTSLARQWNKALADIDRLEKEPTITWPETERPTVPAGKFMIKLNADIASSFLRQAQSGESTLYYPLTFTNFITFTA